MGIAMRKVSHGFIHGAMRCCRGRFWSLPMRTNLRTLALSVTAAAILALASALATAETIDCVRRPTLQCVTSSMFAIARTLPEDDYLRRAHLFAEQELAPGSLGVAVDYLNSDDPDPSPWDDIIWIARAGRFDRAIEEARKSSEPVRRIGGLIAAAEYLGKAGQTTRATKLLEEIEPELSGIDDPDYGAGIVLAAAEVWAQIGQIDHAARLLQTAEPALAVETLLGLAKAHPQAAAGLRRLAWSQAERADLTSIWRTITTDAAERGDAETAAQAGQRALARLRDEPYAALDAATALLALGRSEEVGKAIDPWRTWLTGQQGPQLANLIDRIIPVLAKLGRDAEVEAAARMVTDPVRRSDAFAKAADQVFRLGRRAAAEKLEREAIMVAEAPTVRDPKLRSGLDGALHNIAVLRADHGDIAGALAIVAKIQDRTSAADATYWVIERAMTSGYRDETIPAVESLEQAALRVNDPNLLIRAAEHWHRLGIEDAARKTLAQALRVAGQPAQSKAKLALVPAARLIWELDASTAAIDDALDRFVTTDEELSRLLDTVVDLLIPASPGTALSLSQQIPDAQVRLGALARIAAAVAQSTAR